MFYAGLRLVFTSLCLGTLTMSQKPIPEGEDFIYVFTSNAAWFRRPPCSQLRRTSCLNDAKHVNLDPSNACQTFSSNGVGDIFLAGSNSVLSVVNDTRAHGAGFVEVGFSLPGAQTWTRTGTRGVNEGLSRFILLWVVLLLTMET
jgi:hypothetical protein